MIGLKVTPGHYAIIVTIFPLHTLIAYRAPTRNAFCAMEMFLIAKLQAVAYIVPA